MQSLKGKVALVTGAGKGIGKAIVIALANEGVNVGLIARSEKDLKEVSSLLKQQGVESAYATADVSNRIEIENAIKNITTQLGAIDILINNAGTGTFGNFLQLDPEVWENQIKVNVFGVYYAIRAVLPSMIEKKSGDIINISSTAGKSASASTSA
ncbi:MAG: hypothetical protein NVS3B19_17580 [Ginsengibacter sp.]